MKKTTVILAIIFYSIVSFGQSDYFSKSIIYHESGMDSIKSVKYEYQDTLTAYIFKPQNWEKAKSYPCVIFTSAFYRLNNPSLVNPYLEWSKLLASNGIVTIIYEVNEPDKNFDQLINYITSNSNDLKIDVNKIALWTFSGHTPLALSKINSNELFKCLIIYYGLAVTKDSKYLGEVEELSKQYGFSYKIDSEYNSHTPIMFVRAGKDSWDLVLKTTDEFINEMLRKNVPFKLINYSQGQHSFDVYDNNDESEYVILRTIDFLKRKLEITNNK